MAGRLAVAGSAVANLFLAMGDMQGMERRWQFPGLITGNEAQAPALSLSPSVCVTLICIHSRHTVARDSSPSWRSQG